VYGKVDPPAGTHHFDGAEPVQHGFHFAQCAAHEKVVAGSCRAARNPSACSSKWQPGEVKTVLPARRHRMVCSGRRINLAYTTGFVDYNRRFATRHAQARFATSALLRKRRQGQLLRDAGAALSAIAAWFLRLRFRTSLRNPAEKSLSLLLTELPQNFKDSKARRDAQGFSAGRTLRTQTLVFRSVSFRQGTAAT